MEPSSDQPATQSPRRASTPLVLQRLQMWVASGLVRLHVSAGFMTVLGLLAGVGAGVAAGFEAWWLALVLVLASGLADALDGSVARATRSESTRGAFLDSVFDRVVDASWCAGLFVASTSSEARLAWFVAATAAGVTSYVAARAASLSLGQPHGKLWGRPLRTVMVMGVTAFVALGGSLLVAGVICAVVWGLVAVYRASVALR